MSHLKAIRKMLEIVKREFCYECTGDCDTCDHIGTIREELVILERKYMDEENKTKWKIKLGVITPGGDPYWVCPNCGGGGHLYGVESPNNYKNVCVDCGKELKYPWED